MENLLLALYLGPRCSTLHGRLRHRTNLSVFADAVRSRGSGFVTMSVSGGSPDAADPSEDVESRVEVWIGDYDRCRVDEGGSVRLVTGDEVVTYNESYGALRSSELSQPSPSMPELWCRPQPLLTALDITECVDAEMLGRPCWSVLASRSDLRDPMLDMSLPGDCFEMVIDQATGVVLAMVQSFEKVEVSAMEWSAFEHDSPINADVFDRALPDSVVVRTHTELLAEQVRAQGIDLTGVDVTDQDALIELLHGHRRSPRHQLDQYIATSPPPADVPAARTAIIEAYSLLDEADGDDLLHVEAGEGLASVVQRAAERFSSADATFEVSEVKFLNIDRAAVVFSIHTTNGGSLLADQIGEAVLHEQRWCVARSTFARLMNLAGVDVPAP